MAPKSSAIARAARNIFNEEGTRFPNSDITPNAKAISVAIGIPQPCIVGVFELISEYILAGTIIPPNAANIGIAAFCGLDNSPSIISRFISSPTSRKKIAISPSLIQRDTEYSSAIAELLNPIFVLSKFSNAAPKFEFAMASETITQTIRITPPICSDLKKSLKGFMFIARTNLTKLQNNLKLYFIKGFVGTKKGILMN